MTAMLILTTVSSWMTFRGGNARTGCVPGRANFYTSSPAVLSAWVTEAGSIEAGPLLYDLNGDGREDIYVGGDDDMAPSVVVYRGYDASVLLETSADGYVAWCTPALLDINSDGDPEIFEGFTEGGFICYNGTNGSQIWSASTDTICYSSPLAFTDPSGNPRVAVANDAGTLYYLNATNGAGIWAYPGTDTAWSAPALGDPNNDGNPEIVYTTQGHIYVLSLSGTLLWDLAYGSGGLSSAALADMNGVPGEELVVYDGRGGQLAVFQYGNSTPLWTYPVGALHPYLNYLPAPSPAVGDVNANGTPDVVIHNGATAFCLENGSALWSLNVTSPDLFEASPTLADLDGASVQDGGQLEVVIPGEDTIEAIGVIYYIQSNGTRAWRWSNISYTEFPFWNEAALADPDGDGWLEITAVDMSCYAVILDGTDPFSVDEGESNRGFQIISRGREIRLFMPERAMVSLCLYDGSGRLAENLYEGNLGQGSHLFASRLSVEGVYLAVLRYPGGTMSAKVVVK